MTSASSPRRGRRALVPVLSIAALVAAGLGVFVLQQLGLKLESSLLVVAGLGTAAGTLGLAWYTLSLARVTRESVEGGERMATIASNQLDEIRSQRELLTQQTEAATDQAAQSHLLSAATTQAVLAAHRARIDAIAPLVDMQVRLHRVSYRDGDRLMDLHQTDQWAEADVERLSFEVVLQFSFLNVSRAPARLSFGDTSTRLQQVERDRIGTMTLRKGEAFSDFYTLRFGGRAAIDGELVRMPVTYDGLLHGEMFDHIQWNGWVTPLQVNGGVAKRHPLLLNAAPAQVMRTYPNLDRPEEMEIVRRRIMGNNEEPPEG